MADSRIEQMADAYRQSLEAERFADDVKAGRQFTQQTEPRQFEFRQASQLIAKPKPIAWAIRGVLARNALHSTLGEPKVGKSFIAFDKAACIATGTPWHGHDVVQGPVFYLAGEGHEGIARRLRAWEIVRGVSLANAPLYISTRAAALTDALQANAVADAVKRLTDQSGVAPAVVWIDTLSRNFGPADENKTQDMARFVNHLDEFIREPFGAGVEVVHHTGLAAPGRARGSSALLGAVDCEYMVTRNDRVLTLECLHTKDWAEPAPLAFELCTTELDWIDDLGDPMTSCILRATTAPATSNESKPNLGRNQRQALDALRKLDADHRRRLEVGGLDPDTAKIPIDDWRNESGLPRTRWAEVLRTLTDTGVARKEGPYVVLVERPS